MKTSMTTKQFVIRIILTVISAIIMLVIVAKKHSSAAVEKTASTVTINVNENGRRELVLKDKTVNEGKLTKIYVDLTHFNGYEKIHEEILNLFNLTSKDVNYDYINLDDNDMVNATFADRIPHLNVANYTDKEKIDIINIAGFMERVFDTLERMQEEGIEISVNC